MDKNDQLIFEEHLDIFESINKHYLKKINKDEYDLYLKTDSGDMFVIIENEIHDDFVKSELLKRDIEIRE